jgi:hypothetical protein
VVEQITRFTGAIATPVRSARDRVPIIDRLLIPVGITFVVLVLLQLTDLWLGNA